MYPLLWYLNLGLRLVRVYFQLGQPVSWTAFETGSSSIQITNFLKLLFTTLMFFISIEIMSFLLTFLQRVLNVGSKYVSLHWAFLLVEKSVTGHRKMKASITYMCLTLGSVRYNYTLLNGPLPQGFVKCWVSYRVQEAKFFRPRCL